MIPKMLPFLLFMASVSICCMQATYLTNVITALTEYKEKLNTDRYPRQVIQPKWLITKKDANQFVDEEVRVTNKSLREVAALRKIIQKALEEDIYAVE